VLSVAWAHRAELAGPARLADELAFLPAALSLQETPVHPAPRRFAYLIMGLFVLALVWSVVGEVDIVAVAPGRIIVSDRTKVIQPLEPSVVKAVLVRDGDTVAAGQLLVELDPTLTQADQRSLQEQLQAATAEALRAQSLQQLLIGQRSLPQALAALAAVAPSAAVATAWQSQTQAEWQDISAKLAKLAAESARRQAEIGTVTESIAKLEATVPMAKTRETDYKKLVDQGFISGHSTQDKTRERVELESDLLTLRARLLEAQAAAQETQQATQAVRAETQRNLSDRFAQADTKRKQLQADNAKADQRNQQTQLRAPVAGVVQQLAVHTVGAVVTSAQPLMVIVPEASHVIAQVDIANQDIGFVEVGQRAEIKLETFLFTKYGTVPATVRTVSADAVTDEKRGSLYPTTLELAHADMLIDGKRMPLSPGMNITAEIKTGKRRLIEFLLSPVQRAGSESLRER
jgi:hemolysin D